MADGTELTELVKRAAQANARFYKGWMDLSLEYARGLSEVFSGVGAQSPSMPPIQEMDAGAGALVLEGEAGTAVQGSFLVSNDLERVLSCQFVASDFRDPTGVPVNAKATFSPAAVQLKAGEQQVIVVTIPVDTSFVAGVGYAGEISIGGMDGYAVPIVLRRQHTLDDDSTIQDQSTTPAAQPDTTPVARPASARAKTARSKNAAKRRSK